MSELQNFLTTQDGKPFRICAGTRISWHSQEQKLSILGPYMAPVNINGKQKINFNGYLSTFKTFIKLLCNAIGLESYVIATNNKNITTFELRAT